MKKKLFDFEHEKKEFFKFKKPSGEKLKLKKSEKNLATDAIKLAGAVALLGVGVAVAHDILTD